MKKIKSWLKYKMIEVASRSAAKGRPLMQMRWVLTWKPCKESVDGRKAKARIVILGYEDSTHDGESCMSPTMTRTSRQLFLQLCAWQGAAALSEYRV